MAPLALRTSFVTALFLLSTLVSSQSVGQGYENHPRLTTYKCTNATGCTPRNTYLVLDSLAHPVRQSNGQGCGSFGSAAPSGPCPNAEACQRNCVLSPVSDYTSYGVYANGDQLRLTQLSQTDRSRTVSPRVYLLEEGKQNYEMLSLTGGEFTFDVDLSKLPCGMNGAVYLSEMEKDGGKSKEPLNQAGATYGTGYCDAQCFTTPFINGVANLDGSGSCCNEMDIWEANARSTGIAPHTCARPSLFKCRGTECEWSGLCDEWGCTYNPYKVGQPSFYGTGSNFKVDTRRPFTVVTQFPTDSAGNLIAYRRLYVQDGRVIQNAVINVQSGNVAQFNGQNEMNDAFCLATGGAERYLDLGGTKAMGEALRRGMVLIFSLWWDETGYMQWMDGSATGTGPCNASEGDPRNIRNIEPNPMVTFSQVKWGEMGSTFRVNGKRSWRSDLE